MKRVTPQRPNLPASHAPEPDWVVVRARLEKAGLLDQQEAVTAFLREAMADFWRDKERDEGSATPAQIRDYADRMAKVVAELHPQTPEEATMLRAVLDPFAFAQLVEGLETFAHDLKTLEAEAGSPAKGSGDRLKHKRQLALARRFKQVFAENGWPAETSTNSLMAQLLREVLTPFGERRRTSTLLKDADLNT